MVRARPWGGGLLPCGRRGQRGARGLAHRLAPAVVAGSIAFADSQRAQEGRMSHETETNPYLLGNFGPWRLEGEALDLEVVGKLPVDLAGTYFRNGPNPAYPPLGRYHWFDGDGMVHAIRLEYGRAHYRNRWVRSRGLEEE